MEIAKYNNIILGGNHDVLINLTPKVRGIYTTHCHHKPLTFIFGYTLNMSYLCHTLKNTNPQKLYSLYIILILSSINQYIMKYIIFANSINIDTLCEEDIDEFLEAEPDFCCLSIDEEKDYIKSLQKVERYGSFCFIPKQRYDELVGLGDPL